jgi:hypothetical protein
MKEGAQVNGDLADHEDGNPRQIADDVHKVPVIEVQVGPSEPVEITTASCAFPFASIVSIVKGCSRSAASPCLYA